MKANELVNSPNETELTYEKLKLYKGFENVTEAESVKIIDGIKKLAKILFCLYENDETKNLKTE